jgi:hypothetical protein
MRLLLPLTVVVIGLGFGCATPQPPPEFQPVPEASNIDPSLGHLATETGKQVYAEKEKAKEKPKPKAKSKEQTSKPPKKKSTDTTVPVAPIVTPSSSQPGTVMTYNEAGRFVVLNFPLGTTPSIGDKMFLYRRGLKVGEVKITGPRRDDNIVADLVAGEAQTTDEVRSR